LREMEEDEVRAAMRENSFAAIPRLRALAPG
jgi:hypothetical protein